MSDLANSSSRRAENGRGRGRFTVAIVLGAVISVVGGTLAWNLLSAERAGSERQVSVHWLTTSPLPSLSPSPSNGVVPLGPEQEALERRSHEFWASVTVHEVESEHYTSLPQVAAAADAVVVGTLENIRLGRVVRDWEAEANGADPESSSVYFAQATVRIGENLGGRYPVEADTLRLQFLLPTPWQLPHLIETMPQERAIFFLRDMGRKAARLGLPEELRRTTEGTYDRVSSQGLLRDFGGKVEPPEGAADPFLLALEGSSFQDVVHRVRDAAQPRP